MSDWEDEALEDAFPQAGTTYYLRPQGEPIVKLYSKRDGGEYKKLKCTFWSYPTEEATAQSHFKVLCVTVYPGTIAEFAGKWQSDRVYKTTCQLDGKKKFLHIQSATLIRDALSPPAPPQRQGAGPISPRPPAASVPSEEQGAKPGEMGACLRCGEWHLDNAPCSAPEPARPNQGGAVPSPVKAQSRETHQGANPCPHQWVHYLPDGTFCKACGEKLSWSDGRWQ